MVIVFLLTQLTDTLVRFPIASLVVLVMVLIHMYFANAKVSMTTQFVKFIGRNFGLTFLRRGKSLALFLSRRSQLILSPFPHLHLSPVRRHLFIVPRPAWQSNDKRSRVSLFLFLFITSLRLTKKQYLSQLTTFCLLSIWISVLPWKTKIKYERSLILVTVWKNKNLKKINTSSYNLVTTFNNPLPLKNRTRSTLLDGSRLPDKIKYISPIVTIPVNVISVSPKIWRPNPKIN